jgi:hypothetical protein
MAVWRINRNIRLKPYDAPVLQDSKCTIKVLVFQVEMAILIISFGGSASHNNDYSAPKHGSWLNIAEIELSVLSRQCLDRRMPKQEFLESEVKAWENERNDQIVKMQWLFTTSDAHIKLKHLYPIIEI